MEKSISEIKPEPIVDAKKQELDNETLDKVNGGSYYVDEGRLEMPLNKQKSSGDD